ncbi:MAG: twin-arginine translocase subunit TatC [Beutenbergiaceae bacterium]
MARTTGSRKDNPEARMALGDHLRELRRRVLFAVGGILIGSIVGWIIYPYVFDALQQPIELLKQERTDLASLNFDSVGTAFDMQIRISLFTGVLVTSPWWIFQILAFITPGLTTKERKYMFGFLAAAVPLFSVGAWLAWTVLPRAILVLLGQFTPDGTTVILSASTYLKFVMQFVLAFGIAFLMPLIMVALTFLGIVSGKTWLKAWRWAIVGIFTFCAFATPNPEPTAMILMALPIVGLYFLAVAISFLRDKQVAKRRAAEDAELAASADSGS